MDSAQPIIVKKVKKNSHGHHGGAWKVAFADFVTAMMAFFMLMWLMGTTTPEERAAISDYFQNPSAVQGPGGASTSMIKLGKVDQSLNRKSQEQSRKQEKTPVPPKIKKVEVERDRKRLDNLKHELEKAIDASQALKPFKDQLLLDITPEGLRIQIIDKEGRPMFDIGSATLKPYTVKILHEIAKLINKVPNHISLTGHTDSTPYSRRHGYTNWELSADRANASRRALVAGGLDENKIAKVVGLASTVPFIKTDPGNPMNRRISLIVMNKEAEAALQNPGNTSVHNVQGAKQILNDSGTPQHQQKVPQQIVPRTLKPKLLGPDSLQKPQVKPTPLGGTSSSKTSTSIIQPIRPINPIKLPTS